jgi:tripartite-type tricarboxylate transporter receptor subunit TctC
MKKGSWFGLLAGSTLAVLALHLPAQAAFPERPIKMIVPYAAGGGTDAFARLVAQELSKNIGQPVVVENRTGGGGMVAATAVAQSPADGYTLLVDQSSIATSPILFPGSPIDVNRDLAPVILGVTLDNVLLVSPDLPVNNVGDLIKLAKSKPGKLNYASTGNGTPQHLGMEVFKDMAGIDVLHIPYKGGAPGLIAVSTGEVQMFLISVSTAVPFVKSGRVKALASGGATRSPLLPDLPTVSESGLPGFRSSGWLAVFAPAATPPGVIAELNAQLAKALAAPGLKASLRQQGFEVAAGKPEDLKALMKREMDQYGAVIRKVGIKVD